MSIKSPIISFEGTSHRHSILKDGTCVGSIKALYTNGTQQITGYAVMNYSEDRTLNSSCSTINQAKAFAEYYFGKEAQS